MWLRSMSTWWKACLINRSGPTLISRWQGLQIIKTCILCFCWELRRDHRLCYLPLGPWPKLEHGPRRWRTPQRCPRTSSSLATSLEGKQGRPSQVGAQSLSSSPSRALGVVYCKTDTQITNGLRFWRSIYGCKDNLISQPMEVVLCQNYSIFYENHQNKLTSRICQGAASPSFEPCNVSRLLRDANRHPWMPLRLNN
jgi:hypothetical protein